MCLDYKVSKIININNCTINLTETLKLAFNNGTLKNFTLHSFIRYPNEND